MITSLTAVLVFSVFFQLLAAYYALRLIRITGKTYSWILISIAFFLMCIRSIIPLYFIISNLRFEVDLLNEIIGLILSVLMFIGVLKIKSLFIERNRAVAFRLESEQRLSMIYNSVGDVIFQLAVEDNEKYRFISINQAFCNVTGLSQEQVVGKMVNEVIPEPSLTMVIGKYKQAINENRIIRWEETSHYPAGEVIGEVSIAPVFGKKGDCTNLVGSVHDITERKRIEEELRPSEEKYRLLAESSPEMIFLIDKEGYVRYVNSVAAANFHSDANVLIGKHLTEIYPSDIAHRHLGDINKVFETKQKIQKEIEEEFPNGKIWIDVHLSPLINDKGEVVAVLGLSNNISEHKQAEDLLQESETRLSTIFDNDPTGIIIVNAETRKIYEVNDSALELIGLPKSDVVGKVCHSFLCPAESGRCPISDLGQTLDRSDRVLLKPDGTRVPILKTVVPIKIKGEKYLLESFLDNTDRMRAQQEIKLNNEQLQKANAEKDKFFSIIAHDLRGPFNGLLGLTHLFTEELHTMTQDQIKKCAIEMRKSATKLYSLLENLLEWSMMQRGLHGFNPESFILLNGIVTIIELVRDIANKKRINLNYDIPEDLRILADKRMFETVMRNLVSNAIKFTPREGKITIGAKQISDFLVEISIQDTGIGMNQSIIDDLFDLNNETYRKGTDDEPSTGLGLVICKDFVEKHGGKIWAESEEGKGSTFYFTLSTKVAG